MAPTEAEEIDALYKKFVLGTDPAAAPTPATSAFSASVFMPTAATIAAFAAKFGLSAAALSGDSPEQAAITAKDPSLEIPWPRIAPLSTPPPLDAVSEYAGMGYRPDGTHAACSKALLGKWRHSVELLADPKTDTAAKANTILTGAGDAEPRAVCIALLTGLVNFPTFGSPNYPGYATPDDVIAALTALPAPDVPYAPGQPGPGIAGR